MRGEGDAEGPPIPYLRYDAAIDDLRPEVHLEMIRQLVIAHECRT